MQTEVNIACAQRRPQPIDLQLSVHAPLTHSFCALNCGVCCAQNGQKLTPPSTCSWTFMITANLGKSDRVEWLRKNGDQNVVLRLLTFLL